MLTRRNPNLGNLLVTERAGFYIQLLYRLLLFRRDHELEPLYEEILAAVEPAQDAIDAGAYGSDRLNHDLDQLVDWGLLDRRIEKQRLKGYRDVRKRKFRYGLSGEALAFIVWLEQRLQEDLEDSGTDTRNLLEDACGDLHDILRVLDRFGSDHVQDGDARRILHQLAKLDATSLQTNAELGEFNARMLGFLVRRYDVTDVKGLIDSLERYVRGFLHELQRLRQEIVPLVLRLQSDPYPQLIGKVVVVMQDDRQNDSRLLRQQVDPSHQRDTPERLRAFYKEGGRLDELCTRIHTSAMQVWRKMHAHLRELERKNTRVDDLRARIAEFATLPEDAVPHRFLCELLSSAHMRYDPHYWDEDEKADPPQPRRNPEAKARPPAYLSAKRKHEGPIETMEARRMQQLQGWLESRVFAESTTPATLGDSCFAEFADFRRIIELAGSGYLHGGRQLRKIGYRIETGADVATVTVDKKTLCFEEIVIDQ
jgi:hypothetical protein